MGWWANLKIKIHDLIHINFLGRGCFVSEHMTIVLVKGVNLFWRFAVCELGF